MSKTLFVVVTFDSEERAHEVMKNVEKAEKDKLLEIDDAVVITKDDQGKVHAKNVGRHAAKTGAKWGGTLGLLIGLGLGGPIGGVVVGAAAGGVAGALGDAYSKLLDAGFSKGQIKVVSEKMQNSNSALLLKLESGKVELLRKAAQQSGGEVLEFTVVDLMDGDTGDTFAAGVERDR